MTQDSEQIKREFLYPIGKFNGDFTPQRLAFNANLQEFAQKVSYLCALETNGKISGDETYKEIKQLWKQLKVSKKELLDDSSSDDQNTP